MKTRGLGHNLEKPVTEVIGFSFYISTNLDHRVSVCERGNPGCTS